MIAPPGSADPLAATLLDPLAHKALAPGYALIYRDGDATGTATSGLRARGQPDAIAPTDRFHIGSNTKAMTATLIARLVAKGRLRWSDTIAMHLRPHVAVHPSHGDTTFLDLVNHVSGLPANSAMSVQRALYASDAGAQADRRTYVGQVLAYPAKGPGKFRYSNAGYVTAGAMIEAATSQSWESLLQAELFAPLGMTSAGFGPPKGEDTPQGHRRTLLRGLKPVGQGRGADNPAALGPAGTVHLSPADLMVFLSAHLQQDPDFLPQVQWDILHRPAPGTSYVAGWGVVALNGQTVLQHTGSNTMWFAYIGFSPDTDRAIAILANAGAPLRHDRAMSKTALPFLAP